MSMKHSLTAAVLIVALSATSAGVAFAQESAGAGVGSGSALLSGDLQGGADFQTTPVLNDHVQAAIKYAKAQGGEVGFGFYTNESEGLEYVPGEIRPGQATDDGRVLYRHLPKWQQEDVEQLMIEHDGEADGWKFVGDAHVHKKEKSVKKKGRKKGKKKAKNTTGSINVSDTTTRESQGGATFTRVLEHSGAPSLPDLRGYMENAESQLLLIVAGKAKRGKAFDSSIMFRQGSPAQNSSEHERITDEAASANQPRSHGAAIDILRGAYEGTDIAYFAGRFKGKKGELTEGRFKHRGL